MPTTSDSSKTPDVALAELSGVIRDLCDRHADSKSGKTLLFAICLILIEDMMRDQPTGLRQVWAAKLYQLADDLAVEGASAKT